MFNKLAFVSALSILFPVAASFIRYKSLGRDYYLLFIFFFISFVAEVIGATLNIESKNNIWLINIFTLLECFFWCLVIYQWLASKKIRLFIIFFLAAFFIAWGYTTFFHLDVYQFNNYIRTAESIVFVFLACFLLLAVSVDMEHMLFRNPKFWFGSGLLLYFSVNVIVFSTVNFILDNESHLMDNSWVIHSVSNIISNLLFATGFLCLKPLTISSSPS